VSRTTYRLSFISLILAYACTAFAQSTFGSFVGSVADPGGAAVPGCVVTATNNATMARRSTITDPTGNYVLVNLEAGTYEITVEAKGFSRAVFTNLVLESRQTMRINASLTVASQNEVVNVQASADAVITTDTSAIANAKQGKELLDLPIAIASRGSGSTSPISTLTTQAGVQTDSSGNLSVAGAKPSMLSVSVDGISSVSPRSSAPIAELFPSFGAISEIRVSEINNAAEFGGVSDITTTSRGGSNSFHGGLFNNFQNTALNARNTFSATVPKLDMNDFGVFVGGPVRIPHISRGKDRTFFFASYEGLRLAKESVLLQSVPSAALRTGDLSAYKSFKDPDSGAPFPNNQIPMNRISPISLKALDTFYPMPNTGAAGAIANNYAFNFPTPISSNQGDIRLDQNISSRQTAFVRFSYKKRDVQNAPTGSVNAGATIAPEIDSGFTVAHNFILTPTLVNEFRGGFNGTLSSSSNKTSAVQTLAALGFTGIPDPPPGSGGPSFSITGFQSASFGSSSISKGNTLQFIDNLTWIKGKHTLKFGGDYRYMTAYFSNVFASSRAGSYTFNNSVTSSLIGNAYAAFLLGVPDSTSLATVKYPDTFSYGSSYAFYGQDDWKPTSRLTVNFGLRWEYHPAFNDHFNNLADFLPDYYSVVNGVPVRGAVVVPDKGMQYINPDFVASIAPTPILSASQAKIPQSMHYSQKTSFAPRVGFAWRPFGDDKTVIRGGFGRYVETLLSALITAGWAVEASEVGSYTNSIVNGKAALSFPYAFPANLSQPGVATFEYASALHYKDPYVNQWNLTIERNIGLGTALRVTYDGSHGADLGYSINANQLPANTAGFSAVKSSAPFPIWAHITDYVNGARSNYNALTIAVNKRLSHGLTFQSSYAFTKNLSNGAGYSPTGFTGEAGGRVTDPQNINLDYGNVAFTRRHRFLSTFVYDLPFGKGKTLVSGASPLLDRIVGGWQAAGVLLFQTGPFLTVTASGADPMGTNFPNLEGAGRADIVPGVSWLPQQQTINNWVNAAAFAIPANNIGRPGNSSIGSVVGPGTQAVSVSLFKTVRIKEATAVQLGAAASNVFNHANYAAPSLNLASSSTFGKITSLQSQENGGPRSLQITARIIF
jgi:Carboxypeptidase regulatory-like domain/TonB dependent receptor